MTRPGDENLISFSLQDKDWEILDFSRKKIVQLRKIIPVISDLRNPAMRERC